MLHDGYLCSKDVYHSTRDTCRDHVYHDVSLPRDHVRHDVSGCIQVTRHGTAHQGPVGEEVISHQFQVSYIVILSCIEKHSCYEECMMINLINCAVLQLSKEQALEWQEDCHGQTQV